jgi:hypothetical protein
MKEYTSDIEGARDNPLADISFTLDGVRFVCEGRMSVLESSELAAKATLGAADTRDPVIAAALAATFRMAFGDEVYERFRLHCQGVPGKPTRDDPNPQWIRRPTPDEVVIDILAGLNEEVRQHAEAIAGRPTRGPSTSSSGPEDRAARQSRLISLQTGDVTVIPPPQDHRQPKATGTKAPARKRRTG